MSKLNSREWNPRRRPSGWGLPALFSCATPEQARKGHHGRKRGRVGQVPPLGCLCLQRDKDRRHRALPRPQVRSTFLLQENESGTLSKIVLSWFPPHLPPAVPALLQRINGRLQGTRSATHITRLPQRSTWALSADQHSAYHHLPLQQQLPSCPLFLHDPPSHPPLVYCCAQDQIQLNWWRPSSGLNISRSFQGAFG